MDFLIGRLPDITNSIRTGIITSPAVGRCGSPEATGALAVQVPWLQRLSFPGPTRPGTDGLATEVRPLVPYPVHGRDFSCSEASARVNQQENGKPSSAHQKRVGWGPGCAS